MAVDRLGRRRRGRFRRVSRSWGLPWATNVPVFFAAIVLLGALQHRLAGLGHESSHYTLVHNKFWNDLFGDLFCMVPILTTIHFYRLFHLRIINMSTTPSATPILSTWAAANSSINSLCRNVDSSRFYHLRLFFAPASFMRYQWDYIYVNVLGKGGNVYMRRKPDGDGESRGLRLGTWLGLIYIFGINGLFATLTNLDRPLWTVPAAILGMIGVAIVARAIPDRHFFRARSANLIRAGSAASRGCAFIRSSCSSWRICATQPTADPSLYVSLLWLVPLTTTFPFFMLLRDVYQHANADDGRLTNSRVFFADPFTRWAVFVYGQDMHVPHHLFPAIPHYRLRTLHALLEKRHADYAALVVECHGTFRASKGRKTILDVLTENADAERSRGNSVSVRPRKEDLHRIAELERLVDKPEENGYADSA